MPHRAEAAKRTRLERIVRQLTSELLAWRGVTTGTDLRRKPRGLFGLLRAVGGGCVRRRSAAVLGCTEHVADETCRLRQGLDDPCPDYKDLVLALPNA